MDRVAQLEKILKENKTILAILNLAELIGMPDWYLAGGSIAQTVWNHIHGFDPEFGIKDYDIIYFDSDISYEAEDFFIKKAQEVFRNISAEIDIKNQARVHVWFGGKYGKDIKPFTSVKDSMYTWSNTASPIGVSSRNGVFSVVSPFGIDDVFNLVVRPVEGGLWTPESYMQKTDRWLSTWPKLTRIPWGK